MEVVREVRDRPPGPRLDAVALRGERGPARHRRGLDVAVVDLTTAHRVLLRVRGSEGQEIHGLDLCLLPAVVLGVGHQGHVARHGELGETVWAVDDLPERIGRVGADLTGLVVEELPDLDGTSGGLVRVTDRSIGARLVPRVLGQRCDETQLVREHPVGVVRLVEREGEMSVVDDRQLRPVVRRLALVVVAPVRLVRRHEVVPELDVARGDGLAVAPGPLGECDRRLGAGRVESDVTRDARILVPCDITGRTVVCDEGLPEGCRDRPVVGVELARSAHRQDPVRREVGGKGVVDRVLAGGAARRPAARRAAGQQQRGHGRPRCGEQSPPPRESC